MLLKAMLFNSRNVTLLYHAVSDVRLPHIVHLFKYKSTSQFEEDVSWLLARFRPVSIDELFGWSATSSTRNRNSFLLTFDDGLREVADPVAPILKRHGIPAVVFVNRDFVDNRRMFFRHKASLIIDQLLKEGDAAKRCVQEILVSEGCSMGSVIPEIATLGHKQETILDRAAHRLGIDFEDYLATERPYLTTVQLEELVAQGFIVGAHSCSHPNYLDLTVDEQINESVASIRYVTERWQPKPLSFAFPFNDKGVSPKVFQALGEVGVKLTFGVGRKSQSGSIKRVPADDPGRHLHWAMLRTGITAFLPTWRNPMNYIAPAAQ